MDTLSMLPGSTLARSFAPAGGAGSLVNHDRGCAVAVPSAINTTDAIRQAKQWIDTKLK
ncbi:MAG: hypothetical protein AAFY16_08455 [Cyanobacteria bacterium J06642_3]